MRKYPAIILLLILISNNILAGRHFVSPSGSDENNGKSADFPFKTLHYAISQIAPDSGDTLFLLPGTYELAEPLYIYPGISIIGHADDPSEIIIQPDDSFAGDPDNTLSIALDLQQDRDSKLNKNQFIDGNQTISNFTLLGKKSANEGIVVTGRNHVKINNLIIKNFILGGLKLSAFKEYFVNNYDAGKIKGCEISHCLLYENGSLEPTGNFSYASNISIGGWEGVSLHHCTVIDTVPDMNGSGMGVMGVHRTKIHDNVIMINVFEKNHWGGIFSVVTGYTAGLEFFNNQVNSGISCENRVPFENMYIPGVPDILIFNNRFIGTHPNSVGIQAIELYNDNAEIFNNYFENFFHCITSWHGNDTVTNVDIHHNVFRGAAKGYAIHLTMGGNSYNDPANHSVYTNFNIYSNVFDNFRYAIYNPHGKAENFSVKNNVFMNLGEGIWQHTSEEACNNIIFDHNLAFNHGELQNNNSAIFTNSIINTDPGFRLEGERPSEWYRPSSSSSAVIDQGIDLNEYTLGFTGTAPDLGAYEWNTTAPSRLAAPDFTLPTGKYFGDQEIIITSVDANTDIYFTIDGSEPTAETGNIYNEPFILTQPATVKAVAIQNNMINSVINERSYEIVKQRANKVNINPAGTRFSYPQIISLDCSTPNASIYYSVNGRLPNKATGYLYEGPFYLDSTITISAIAYAEGVYQSEIITNSIEINFTDPGTGIIYNDTSSRFTWSEHYWAHKTNRGLGDYNDDIHITYNQGAYFEFEFTGKGIALIMERNTDKTKSADIFIDDKPLTSISLYSNKQLVSDTVFIHGGLSAGNHRLKVLNSGIGGNMAVDAVIVYNDPLDQNTKQIDNKYQVYPNPGREYIILDGLNQNLYHTLMIYDARGLLKSSIKVQRGTSKIRVATENFPTGIYFFMINNNEEMQCLKVKLIK